MLPHCPNDPRDPVGVEPRSTTSPTNTFILPSKWGIQDPRTNFIILHVKPHMSIVDFWSSPMQCPKTVARLASNLLIATVACDRLGTSAEEFGDWKKVPDFRNPALNIIHYCRNTNKNRKLMARKLKWYVISISLSRYCDSNTIFIHYSDSSTKLFLIAYFWLHSTVHPASCHYI